jgi:hypothetical protein
VPFFGNPTFLLSLCFLHFVFVSTAFCFFNLLRVVALLPLLLLFVVVLQEERERKRACMCST